MSIAPYPWTYPFDLPKLGDKPVSLVLELDDATRNAFLEAYQLLELPKFKAELEVRRWRKNGVAVRGTVVAKTVQACVVSLQPVSGEVDESFERTFLPEDDGSKRRKTEDEDLEIEVDFDAEDPPETFSGRQLDLGAIVCEQFALGLDLYPRAEGVHVDEAYAPSPEDELEDEKEPSPFAALEALKKDLKD
ncbi:DUF177 domain-containing protein [Pseudovibrio sp. SPO723]|uniref:YceD family protein n=1 Tax=Nesiotobacter zosterae TaxID=392721 RepID=UPI0029C301BE|nr:DUF177 domain-containing protein [Pseudovibrio sp. SPO723]MDX5592522.1 DUF177 domain-containing protein [Pseudovibrio sp. SPO723]